VRVDVGAVAVAVAVVVAPILADVAVALLSYSSMLVGLIEGVVSLISSIKLVLHQKRRLPKQSLIKSIARQSLCCWASFVRRTTKAHEREGV
jgi:hypothetical protein